MRKLIIYMSIISVSTVAFAADVVPSANPPAVNDRNYANSWTNWTGPYIGVNVGAGWSMGQLNVPNSAAFSGIGLLGASAGLTGGYDYLFGSNVVGGLVLDANIKTVNAHATTTSGDSAGMTEAYSWALRGKLGVLADERTFIYGTAGFSEIGLNAAISNGVSTASQNDRLNGAVFGGGIETRLQDDWFGYVEYLHGIYQKQSYVGGLFNITPSTDDIRVGIVYRPSDLAAGSSPAWNSHVVENWAGGYIGLQGGWGSTRTVISAANVGSFNGLDGSGPIGGFVVGYDIQGADVQGADYQTSKSVAGIEVDGSIASTKSTLNIDSGPTAYGAQLTYDYDFSVRGRIGQAFSDTLLYATGGWSETRAELTTTGLGGASGSHVFNGLQLGVGAETMFSEHVGARLEYLQTFYEKYADIRGSTIGVQPTSGKTRVALIYKF